MLELAGRRGRLRVVSDQHCTPSYVPHVARAICFLLGTAAYGTYHVTNRGATTWYELAAEIFRRSGLAVELEPITTVEYGARAPRPKYSVLQTNKYHALPGRPAMPFWHSALAEYLGARREAR
jgi:dTDP-4-dehydrorhamnose reductase